MTEHFSIGEIAIYHNPGNPNHGTEVTITSTLQGTATRDMWTAEYVIVEGHFVNVSDNWIHGPLYKGITYFNRIERLRKKRPPQELSSWDALSSIWIPKGLKQYESI